MTGNDIFRQVMSLLNYTDTDGAVPFGEGVYRQALPYINQVVAELWYAEQREPFVPLRSLNEAIPLPPAVLHTVLPYGVAMLTAGALGDADQQAIFARLYDARRIPSRHTETMVDTLPEVEA